MSERTVERWVYADADSAIGRLRRNGINADSCSKVVLFNDRRIPGIALWGAIDYLKRFHGWGWGKTR